MMRGFAELQHCLGALYLIFPEDVFREAFSLELCLELLPHFLLVVAEAVLITLIAKPHRDGVHLVLYRVQAAVLVVDEFRLRLVGVVQLNRVEKHVDAKLLIDQLRGDHADHAAFAVVQRGRIAMLLEHRVELLQGELAVFDKRNHLSLVDGGLAGGVELGVRVVGFGSQVLENGVELPDCRCDLVEVDAGRLRAAVHGPRKGVDALDLRGGRTVTHPGGRGRLLSLW